MEELHKRLTNFKWQNGRINHREEQLMNPVESKGKKKSVSSSPTTRELTGHLSEALEELERLEKRLESSEAEAKRQARRAEKLSDEVARLESELKNEIQSHVETTVSHEQQLVESAGSPKGNREMKHALQQQRKDSVKQTEKITKLHLEVLEAETQLEQMEERLQNALNTIKLQASRIKAIEVERDSLRIELNNAKRGVRELRRDSNGQASPPPKEGMSTLNKCAIQLQRIWRGRKQREKFWRYVDILCEQVDVQAETDDRY